MNFTCPRTCPHYDRRTADGHFDCRFRAVLDHVGPTRVHSHTVKIKVEYRDPRVLERACNNLGWKWHGQAKHHLYEADVQGHGFTPEGWSYPAVLASDGELHYDTFNGHWGDETKLEALRSEYAMVAAEQAAMDLGWQTQRTETGLTVFHPQGGILTVSRDGVCETTGFVGSSCHDARTALKLVADGAITEKPEVGAVVAQVHAGN